MPHSECIMLHIGQAGVQVGHACWELFCLEHGIYPNGQMVCGVNGLVGPDSGSHNTFFAEKVSGHFVPRTILFDTEPTVIDEVRTGAYRHLFSPDMMITGKEDAANNYARGYYTTGREYIGVMMERLRRQAEMCDALQGFFLCRSLGGGTGSGFVAYFLEKLTATFGKKTRISLDVFPSPNISTAVVEPYNSLLTTHSTMDNTDVTFIYDNEALYRICGTQLTNHRPTYHNLNRLIAQVVSGMTASVRFSGGSNVSIREFQTNLVPYPRVHFPLVAYAPIVSAEQAYHERFGVNQLVRAIFESHNQMVTCDTTKGKYMAVSLLFRGDVTPNDVNFTLSALKAGTCSGRGRLPFVDWAPNAYKVGLCARSPVCVPGGDLAETPRAVVGMMNTTAIRQPWRRLVRKFNVMFQKRAFVHWYVGEGMEETEFRDAREDMMALYDDYELINRGRSDKVKLAPTKAKKEIYHPIGPNFTPIKPHAQKGKAR